MVNLVHLNRPWYIVSTDDGHQCSYTFIEIKDFLHTRTSMVLEQILSTGKTGIVYTVKCF